MRRSHAPSLKKLPDSGHRFSSSSGVENAGNRDAGAQSGPSDGKHAGAITGESIVARRNAAAVASGKCIVSREPLTNWLMVQQGRPVTSKFVSPCTSRSSDSDELFKKKSLGVRKPHAHMFIKSTGVPGMTKFQPVLQDMTNLDGNEALRLGEAEGDVLPSEGTEAKALEEEPTWEPLVLWEGEVENDEGQKVTHRIQVEDRLCKVLRPHQREGVHFVFECLTGLREGFEGQGCILADDMGLGKTLQSIVVLHTLLKKGFKPGERVARKALVVTPTSLIKNWANEIAKWVGDDPDLQVVAVTESGKNIKIEINRFLSNPRNRVLIISYETFRGHAKSFPAGCAGCCDILICDEAHRLKNAETATNQALAKLHCRRRVLLSGTPLQNDLNEFYAMVDFTNPGILGTPAQFRRQVVRHVLAGREPDATDAEVLKAQRCQYDMSTLVNHFILRRTNTLNAQHLPAKLVQVVCCRLTPLQKNVYKHLLSSKEIRHICEGKQTNILSSIGALQKLCNHPMLLQECSPSSSSSRGGPAVNYGGGGSNKGQGIGLQEIAHLLPPPVSNVRSAGAGERGAHQRVQADMSGKMLVLEQLMQQMRATGKERIVVVSNYTQTLDMIGRLCNWRNWPVIRLDGSTNVTKRQKLVDIFNDVHSNSFAFLLSSKAGGCGINLIGANRLVLFDPDWNPAVDKQAAARVWREGQQRRCFIYRFVSTGTIEEKIFMRQLSKEGLQSIVDDKEEVNSLSSKDLRQLFRFDETTVSDTHKKLACKRCPTAALQGGTGGAEEAAAGVGLNKAQCEAVRGLVVELQDGSLMQAVSNDLNELVARLPVEERVELLNWAEVLRRLDDGEYADLPAFTKHMRRQLTAVDKAVAKAAADCAASGAAGSRNDTEGSGEGRGTDLAQLQTGLYRLSTAFERQWRALAPTLLSLRYQSNEEKKEEEVAMDRAKPAKVDMTASSAAEENRVKKGLEEQEETVEEGNRFQAQVGMPLEEDLNNWSHHWNVETVDDPVFREAMLGLGTDMDVVSFVFGLEVTWSLLQQYPQPEVKRRERPGGESEEEEDKGESSGDDAGSDEAGGGQDGNSEDDADGSRSGSEMEDTEGQEAKSDVVYRRGRLVTRKQRGRPQKLVKEDTSFPSEAISRGKEKGEQKKGENVAVEDEDESSDSSSSKSSVASSSSFQNSEEGWIKSPGKDLDDTESEREVEDKRGKEEAMKRAKTTRTTHPRDQDMKDVLLLLTDDESSAAEDGEDDDGDEDTKRSVNAATGEVEQADKGPDAKNDEKGEDGQGRHHLSLEAQVYEEEMAFMDSTGCGDDDYDFQATSEKEDEAFLTAKRSRNKSAVKVLEGGNDKIDEKRESEGTGRKRAATLSPQKMKGHKKASGRSNEQEKYSSQGGTESTAWVCPACTYENSSRRKKCEVCHAEKKLLTSHSRRSRGSSQSSASPGEDMDPSP